MCVGVGAVVGGVVCVWMWVWVCVVGKDVALGVSLPILVFSFAEVGNLHQKLHFNHFI